MNDTKPNTKKLYIIAHTQNENGNQTEKVFGPFSTYSEAKEYMEVELLDDERVNAADIVTLSRRFTIKSVRQIFED
jgi:hypothetical protein